MKTDVLTELIGADAVAKIIAIYGGMTLYIPQQQKPCTPPCATDSVPDTKNMDISRLNAADDIWAEHGGDAAQLFLLGA